MKDKKIFILKFALNEDNEVVDNVWVTYKLPELTFNEEHDLVYKFYDFIDRKWCEFSYNVVRLDSIEVRKMIRGK